MGELPPVAALGQYGALGVISMIFLWFGWQVYKRERDRADANAAEVARLNQRIADIYVPNLEKWLIEAGEQRRLLQAVLDERSSPRRRS